jgi:hypothetical protein
MLLDLLANAWWHAVLMDAKTDRVDQDALLHAGERADRRIRGFAF